MTGQSSAEEMGFASPTEELHAFMRLKGSIRNEAWPLRYFGVIQAQFPDGTVRPFIGFEGLEHTRFVPQADGSFNMIESMVTYFTDIDSGEYLSSFDNPITGKTNRPVSNYAAGESYNFSATAITPLFGPYTDPGTGMGLRWFRSADRVWVQYDRTYPDQWFTPSAELVTFEGPAEAVLRTDVGGVEAAFCSTTILPWFKWLEMDDVPGWTLWHANGDKVRSLDRLPQRLLDQLEKHHPQALLTPGEGNWKGL
ncbi:hypothetical protein FHS31_002173 [Sphingomonas vulcanisoli]|uniref:DUF1838 domain-containing protein n=1 Tax=Sphingomonas vulcanisoli TaxID=1658060 RepID=A0ABX0TSU8_9SPHN|nr:DUF1838 family protein [Sphingomonas vulcanisoli]NIJ08552.1 hypothetical protein [Sphingomonas vulcanisoli]